MVDTKVNVTFHDNIEEVEIKHPEAMVDLLGIGGPSLKKLKVEVKKIDLFSLCDVVGQTKGTTFEVDIENTICELFQNQHCSGGQNGWRKIELQISDSTLVVRGYSYK